MLDLPTICQQVQQVARETGGYIREARKQLNDKQIAAKGKSDFVTDIDKESERRLVQQLAEVLPEAGFITEEDTEDVIKTYNWIIDPLDGTTNFIHGIPPYSVSIALARGNDMLMGVVYEITGDELFYAWQNGGAWLNGERIHVTRAATLEQSLITTGFPYEPFNRFEGMFNTLKYIVPRSHGLRRLGSAATDMAYLAAGRMEVFYEVGLHAWDVAAAICIVKEAGGHVTDFSGGTNYLYGSEMLATNNHVHKEMQSVLERYFV